MTHSQKIDLMKVPRDLWGRREYLLSEALPGVLAFSTEHVRHRYKSRKQLETSCWFMENELMDAPHGDLDSLERVGFFPWIEAQHELCVALDQTLLGFYRASYDHQRRSLELILVGSLFVSEQTTEAEARAWMNSDDKTPMFTRTLQRLSAADLYAKLEAKTGGVSDVRAFYWRLSNISHVRRCPERT